MVALRFSDLQDDPDSYLGIAQNLAAGRGYSIPESTQPTAFRPPLYPILIAPCSSQSFAGATGRALLNVAAAAASLILIWKTAVRFKLSAWGCCVALLVYGLDPLLLRYAALSMTETCCSLMSALLLWRMTCTCFAEEQVGTKACEAASIGSKETHSPPEQAVRKRWSGPLLTGLVFGLCVLTRPTYWAFALLFSGFLGVTCLRGRATWKGTLERQLILSGIGVVVVVGPWVLRNLLVLGAPIVMTTHGGYTLLLGNNSAFYHEVVEGPFGTVWEGTQGPSQAEWVDGINREMNQLGLKSELERDRWMGNLAKQTIRESPGLFLKACALRAIRFWNIVPSGPAAEQISGLSRLVVGGFYAGVWCVMVLGCKRLILSRTVWQPGWVAVILLVLAFAGVHLIYWSNVRMRAPIVPAIALLAGAGVHRKEIDASA